MGCAGSKPHMLLSSASGGANNNLNSPQKGFILFNAKTIEYLMANEADTKAKLVKRCQPKLLKAKMPASVSKSSLLGAKKSLFSANGSNTTTTDRAELSTNVTTAKTETSKIGYLNNYKFNFH